MMPRAATKPKPDAAPPAIKFDVRNRWTGEVQFTAELDCLESASPRIKMGLAVRWARKSRADLSGADLSRADLSDADLRRADLSGADLRGADLSRAVLSDAVLRDADLSDAVLRDADLSDADLSDAVLSRADLSDADWIPKIPDIHKAVYAAASAPDALDMGTWHRCGTTHCRAGWVTTLAGEGGRVLEGVYGTAAAAALIYQASDPTLEKIPNFYASDAAALADMKRLADQVSA